MGRKEAIYFYEPDGLGPCYAFEAEKRILMWYRGYLLVVARDNNNPKVGFVSGWCVCSYLGIAGECVHGVRFEEQADCLSGQLWRYCTCDV